MSLCCLAKGHPKSPRKTTAQKTRGALLKKRISKNKIAHTVLWSFFDTSTCDHEIHEKVKIILEELPYFPEQQPPRLLFREVRYVQEENKIHELKLITTMSSEMILLTITIMVSVPHSPLKRSHLSPPFPICPQNSPLYPPYMPPHICPPICAN